MAQLLLDTDWRRFGGAAPDADGTALKLDGDAVIVDLPSCPGKLIRLASA